MCTGTCCITSFYGAAGLGLERGGLGDRVAGLSVQPHRLLEVQQSKRSALLELPNQLHGGDLAGLLASLGLAATRVSGNTWSIHADTPGGRHHDLLTARTVAGPPRREPQFDILPNVVDELPAHQLTPEALTTLEKIRANAASDDDLKTQLLYSQIELTQASRQRCGQFTEQHFGLLGRYTLNDTDELLLPNRSAHVVTITQTLLRRVKLPSIALRMAQDPTVINELRDGSAQVPSSGLLFGSAAQQANSLVLSGSFLDPLMGCLLPYVWGYACPRPMSTVLFGFGRALPAANGLEAREMLELLQRSGRNSAVSLPTFTRTAAGEAIDWWVMRLNQLFRYLTDPATYIDSQDRYVPHEQLHWMLTLSQVLQLTASLQTTIRDTTAQRVIAFTLLGSFADRLLGEKVELKTLFSAKYAQEQFNFVKSCMNNHAAEILLPAAQRALDALQQLQKGFFISEQRGIKAVRIHMPNGAVKEFNREDAAARLMVIHRNATHGYGRGAKPKSVTSAEVGERLLAQHDGRIPDDLALLPYLYLLAAFCRPDDIRDRIIEQIAVM